MQEVNSLVQIISEIGRFHGKDYLNKLASKLAELISADHVYISRIGQDELVDVVAGHRPDRLVELFSYPLATTPCYEALHQGSCVYNLNLKAEFPDDQFLFEEDLNSYIGLALVDKDRKTIGLLTALYHDKIINEERAVGIFELVGIRAGAELERMSYEDELLVSNQCLQDANRDFSLFREIVKLSGNGVVVTDESHKIVSINPAYERITQRPEVELMGALYPFSAVFQEGKKFEKRVVVDVNTGSVLEVSKILIPYVAGQETERRVYFCRDITEEKKASRRLNHHARYDSLTSISSRFAYTEWVNQHIFDQPRSLKSIIVFSIDNFKSINESMGHAVGDELLKSVAGKIHLDDLTVPPGRVGSNEFSLFVDCNTSACVLKYLDQLYERVCVDTKILNVSVPVTISVGIAIYPDDASDAEDLINCASQALTQSKKMGPNNHSFFLSQMKTSSTRFSTIYQKLSALMAANELDVHYQAIVDLKDGTICGAEALARWTDPALGYISPVEFIEVAEKTGLICQLGEQVFKQAAKFLSELSQGQNLNFCMSVNCSPYEILNYREAQRNKILMLEHLGLDPENVHIELTENVMVEDKELAIERMVELSNSGFSLSIDDFGTGFSSLSYLKDYPFDILKIDRSFIAGVAEDEGSRNVVRIIIDLAKSFGVRVIAEGVTNKDQLDTLLELGCDMAQGFYFHKPEAAISFKALVDSKPSYYRQEQTQESRGLSRLEDVNSIMDCNILEK